MKKIALFFILITAIWGFNLNAENIELEGLGKPSYITADSTNLYVVDGAAVKIFSLKDYSKTGEFGKKGSGPGEFQAGRRGSPQIIVNPLEDNLQIYNARRHLFFSKTGKYLKENKIGKRTSPLTPFKGGFLGTMFARADNGFVVKFVWLDGKYDNVKELAAWSRNRSRGFNIFGQSIKYAGVKDRIFWFDADKGVINSADKSGKSFGASEIKITKRELTDSDNEDIREYFKLRFGNFYNRMKDRMQFPEFFPGVMSMAGDAGKLCIITWNVKDGKREVILCNAKGKEIKRGFYPIAMENAMNIAPYFFKEGKIHQIVENEDEEEWELSVIDIVNS